MQEHEIILLRSLARREQEQEALKDKFTRLLLKHRMGVLQNPDAIAICKRYDYNAQKILVIEAMQVEPSRQ